MYREDEQIRERCAVLGQHCTLTKKWSNAPPHNTRPACAGKLRAGPHLARCLFRKGGDE